MPPLKCFLAWVYIIMQSWKYPTVEITCLTFREASLHQRWHKVQARLEKYRWHNREKVIFKVVIEHHICLKEINLCWELYIVFPTHPNRHTEGSKGPWTDSFPSVDSPRREASSLPLNTVQYNLWKCLSCLLTRFVKTAVSNDLKII